MVTWRVAWLIDVQAENAAEAAMIAREIQQDRGNSAYIYRVNNGTSGGSLVCVSDDEKASNYDCYVTPLPLSSATPADTGP